MQRDTKILSKLWTPSNDMQFKAQKERDPSDKALSSQSLCISVSPGWVDMSLLPVEKRPKLVRQSVRELSYCKNQMAQFLLSHMITDHHFAASFTYFSLCFVFP